MRLSVFVRGTFPLFLTIRANAMQAACRSPCMRLSVASLHVRTHVAGGTHSALFLANAGRSNQLASPCHCGSSRGHGLPPTIFPPRGQAARRTKRGCTMDCLVGAPISPEPSLKPLRERKSGHESCFSTEASSAGDLEFSNARQSERIRSAVSDVSASKPAPANAPKAQLPGKEQRGPKPDPKLKGLLMITVDPNCADSPYVIIGRNDAQNERVSFSVARPSDLWFHANGVPGGHVLLREAEGATHRFSREAKRFAADCAAYFSKNKNAPQCDVLCAEVSRLKKPPGAPLGTVQVKEAKSLILGVPKRVAPRIQAAIEERKLQSDKGNKQRQRPPLPVTEAAGSPAPPSAAVTTPLSVTKEAETGCASGESNER